MVSFKVGDKVVSRDPTVICSPFKGVVGTIIKVYDEASYEIEYPCGTTQVGYLNADSLELVDWYFNESDVEAVEDNTKVDHELSIGDCTVTFHDVSVTPKAFDPVSKPSHYNQGDGIECIDYIKQVLGPDGFVAYCRGNLIKYNHRATYKGKPLEDMSKGLQYLSWATETLKEMKEESDTND